jgi:hypothetical protein
MARMNIDRARGGDDDFGGVGAEPTMPAKYAGTCGTCGQRFAVGDPIASILVDKKRTYHHGACRYPATALLGEEAEAGAVGAVPSARTRSDPGRCRALTNKGKPCGNAPQRGEHLCGPHLAQLASRPASERQPTARPEPDDEPF